MEIKINEYTYSRSYGKMEYFIISWKEIEKRFIWASTGFYQMELGQ